MPLYEYRCASCDQRLEELQAVGSPPPGACPACGGELKRMWSRVGVRFSGWGFRSTDGLLTDGRPRRDFKRLKEKAEEIVDSD